MEDEIGALHNKIDQMAADMAELKKFIMSTQQPEKKALLPDGWRVITGKQPSQANSDNG